MSITNELDALLAALTPRGVDYSALASTSLAPLIGKMENTPQNPLHHAEGNVLEHTKRVIFGLVKLPEFREAGEAEQKMLLLSALLHDIGKIVTTKEIDGEIVSPGHSRVGAVMARELLFRMGLSGSTEKQSLREAVCAMIKYHSLPPYAMKENGIERRLIGIAAEGELSKPFSLRALCTLERADILGRIAPDGKEYLDRVEYCALLAEELGCLDAPYPFSDPYSERAYFRGKTEWAGQSLYNESTCTVIMLSGLPGTGKDTYIRSAYPELPMVSLDGVRRELGVLPTEDQGRVIAEATERMRVHLRKGQSFVYNATNLLSQIRRKWIDLFEAYGASVELVFLECPYEVSLERNAGRVGVEVVPEYVISSMLSKLEVPERHEAESVKRLIT